MVRADRVSARKEPCCRRRCRKGNGTQVTASHDPATGAVLQLMDATGTTLAQDLLLSWDAMGNLLSRRDWSGNRDQEEQFFYDARNRLTRTDSRTGAGGWVLNQQVQSYNTAGNIVTKTGLGTYTYGSTRPHAVTSAGGVTYTYDANGNVTSDTSGRAFHYTAHDLARRANPAAGSGEYRRSIGGVAIATYFAASGIDRVRFLHTDHLGSTVAISTETGQVETELGFDAWGQRRPGDWNQSPWQQWLNPLTPAWASTALAITPRGYTGHEHVDAMGIIHMNGRIYDPHLGRFLQADPFVEDSTTLNRYTYVHNNPLSLTDPSGFFSFGKFFRTIAAVAISVYTGGLAAGQFLFFGSTLQGFGAFAAAVVGGAAAGGIGAGSIDGALWGAFSGAVFFGIGQQFGGSLTPGEGVFGTAFTPGELARASIAHGMAGGTIAEMQGGKFGHGFISSGVSKAATPGIAASKLNLYEQGFALAIVGGTTSRISGGKFANGAVTSAMAFAFNQVVSSSSQRSSNDSGGQMVSGGFRLLGEDFSGNENFVLVRDPRTNTAWFVPRAIAPEVLEAIASNRTDMAGASRSGVFQVGAGAFLGIAGVSVSGGGVIDSNGRACGFISACVQIGLGLGAGAGGGGALSVSTIEPGVSRSDGVFGFGGTGIISSGSLDLSNGGAVLDFVGPGAGLAAGYQRCIQNNFACN